MTTTQTPAHYHAVSDSMNWTCAYAHPYASRIDAADYMVAAAEDGIRVTIVECPGI